MCLFLEAPMRRQSHHPLWWSGGQACNTTSESASALAGSSASCPRSFVGSDDRRLSPSIRRCRVAFCRELEVNALRVISQGYLAIGDTMQRNVLCDTQKNRRRRRLHNVRQVRNSSVCYRTSVDVTNLQKSNETNCLRMENGWTKIPLFVLTACRRDKMCANTQWRTAAADRTVNYFNKQFSS